MKRLHATLARPLLWAVAAAAQTAPGFPGTYQVNILVPADVPSGTRVISISNAGNASQGLVAIEVQ